MQSAICQSVSQTSVIAIFSKLKHNRLMHQHPSYKHTHQDITCSHSCNGMVDCARPCQLVCIDRSYSHTKSYFITIFFQSFLFHQASSEYFQLILFYVHQIPLWFLAASHQAVSLLPEMLPCSSTRRWFPNVCIKVPLHSFNSAPCFMKWTFHWL